MSKLKTSLQLVYPRVEDKLCILTSSQVLKTHYKLISMKNVHEAYNAIVTPIQISLNRG
jgi:hypothetical protein